MPTTTNHEGYEIRASSMPAHVRIIVGGKEVAVVQQGFSPHFAITLHKGNESLDRPYSSSAVYTSEEEAEIAAISMAKAVIDGEIEGLAPPE